MAKVYVDNRNKVYERFCTSFDGEQVQVNPGAKRAPIDEKFTWKMHPDVSLSAGSVRTFKTANEEIKEQKDREDAEFAELERQEAEREAQNKSDGSPQVQA